MRSLRAALCGAWCLCVPAALDAQRSALDSLAAEAERLTARYADRRVAVSEGYRRLGADFPGMGEHWLHPGALLAGTIDAARPTLLMYASFAGQSAPMLLGVGFVRAVRPGTATAHPPGWPEAWHEHSGLLADESGVSPGLHDVSATQVWVLHAWTAVTNDGGRYAADNWGLPFRRAGLPVPAGVDADAGRALSLAVHGDTYLVGLLTDAGLRTQQNSSAIDSVIAASRLRAENVIVVAQRAGHALAGDVAMLRGEWRVLGNSLRTLAGPAIEPYLRAPHAAVHGAHHGNPPR